MQLWQIVLLVAAAYVAVTTLVRMMRQRHDELVANMRAQLEQERSRQQPK